MGSTLRGLPVAGLATGSAWRFPCIFLRSFPLPSPTPFSAFDPVPSKNNHETLKWVRFYPNYLPLVVQLDQFGVCASLVISWVAFLGLPLLVLICHLQKNKPNP